MKTFLIDVLPKIQQYSKKLDEITLLTNQHWVLMDSIGSQKSIYIFRANQELLVSSNGKVTKGKWEYLGNNSILIDISTNSYLYKNGFFDKNVLALKKDNEQEYSIFVNENKNEGELNSIKALADFLESKYLNKGISINESIEGSLNKDIKIEETSNPYSIRGTLLSILAIFILLALIYFASNSR